ncbi:dihydroxyacetone kinase [Gracilaria domingensis]|nr:dihydroxyacetone kinase [Gracilaria domingensis]
MTAHKPGRYPVELGMGIHGEPGTERQSLHLENTTPFTRNLVSGICSRLDTALSRKQELVSICTGLAIMVNNLGAVPKSEMLIVTEGIADYLFSGNGQVINGNLHPVHMFSGSFMTSLQMNGVSITCLVLSEKDAIVEELLHAPTVCESWSKGFQIGPPSERPVFFGASCASSAKEVIELSAGSSAGDSGRDLSLQTENYIVAIADSLLEKCDELGALDRLTGDGDLGDTVRKACEKVKTDLRTGRYAQAAGNPHMLFSMIASSAGASGGSMGIFTRIFLQEMASYYKKQAGESKAPLWRDAFVEGTNAVMRHGRANVGDRTLVDSLKPAADVLATPNGTLVQAAQAAQVGSDSTKHMTKAKFGRSKNVDSRMLLNHPDPGSVLVCTVMNAIAKASRS